MKTMSLDKTAAHPGAFTSALHAKCPKCREGNMFANPMYGLKGQQMHKNCPVCDYQFEIEPGYFYVAMFVSYAMNVAEMVTFAVGTYILTGSENPWLYIGILLGVSLILSPFNFRYSRVILLYWLTPGLFYDPERVARMKKM
ncbi:DUF983 domain-containing protein [Mucilaginibacter mali]|uniref:DUF983 domain-containing protein n=2 Tax=Mucilaginibacter mali TaxID=2740462 RepID=A0A7D4TRF1_9SPHI|nr:DUF983 domain-containing protein [Mucilaginibacter mali]